MVDAVFRGGKKHSNHGERVAQMVRNMVGKIRRHYRQQAAIVVRMDSGFFDQDLFEVFAGLKIGYICSGRPYEDIRAYVEAVDESGWGRYQNAE